MNGENTFNMLARLSSPSGEFIGQLPHSRELAATVPGHAPLGSTRGMACSIMSELSSLYRDYVGRSWPASGISINTRPTGIVLIVQTRNREPHYALRQDAFDITTTISPFSKFIWGACLKVTIGFILCRGQQRIL